MILTYSKMHHLESTYNSSFIWQVSLNGSVLVSVLIVCLWVRISLQSLKVQILHLLWARISLISKPTLECVLTFKLLRDITITHTLMYRTDKYSQQSSIIWSVWLNGSVFVSVLTGCRFESRYCSLNFRYGACFEQRVP